MTFKFALNRSVKKKDIKQANDWSEQFPLTTAYLSRVHMVDRIPAHAELALSKRAYEFRHSFREWISIVQDFNGFYKAAWMDLDMDGDDEKKIWKEPNKRKRIFGVFDANPLNMFKRVFA